MLIQASHRSRSIWNDFQTFEADLGECARWRVVVSSCSTLHSCQDSHEVLDGTIYGAAEEQQGKFAGSWLEIDPAVTVLSTDGIGAFDLVSRQAMLQGLLRVAGGDSALPFVMQFYGAPSFLWEDQDGVVRTITQAEGGEQGDPLMRALFPLGAHPGTSGLASTTSGRRAHLRILRRRVCCVFAGSGQCHLWTTAECALHTGLEQRRRGAVWHRGDGSSRKNHRS